MQGTCMHACTAHEHPVCTPGCHARHMHVGTARECITHKPPTVGRQLQNDRSHDMEINTSVNRKLRMDALPNITNLHVGGAHSMTIGSSPSMQRHDGHTTSSNTRAEHLCPITNAGKCDQLQAERTCHDNQGRMTATQCIWMRASHDMCSRVASPASGMRPCHDNQGSI